MEGLHRRIEDWLVSFEPGSEIQRIWSLKGGISARMTAFSFKSGNGSETRTWILRQPNQWTLNNLPNHVAHEFSRYGALKKCGLPVQAPVYHDDSGDDFGSPGLVIEYVEGKPDFDPVDLRSYLKQSARQLSEIHLTEVRNEEDLFLPEKKMLGFERFREGTQPKADPVFQVGRIWAILKEHANRPSTNQPVLLHGDFWPGNTIWQNGRLVAVIDWEETVMGDPLHDLSISRLDLWWAFGLEAAQFFTRRYLEHNPADPTLIPLWDLQVALRPVTNLEEWAASYGPMGRPDVTFDHLKQVHSDFVAQAFEAIGGLGD